jgi:uncharacterized membrane protein YdbT with pleckstrin-like domain
VFSSTVDQPKMPTQIGDYLLPGEKVTVVVRHHIAYIAGPLVIAPVSLIIVIVLTIALAARYGGAVEVLWLLWLIPVGYCLWKYTDWRRTYFLATHKRLLLVSGVFGRSVATLPLTKVTDLKLTQSPLAKSVGFGTFEVESAGQDQTLRNIRFVPYPRYLYLEIMALIHPDAAEDPDADPGF